MSRSRFNKPADSSARVSRSSRSRKSLSNAILFDTRRRADAVIIAFRLGQDMREHRLGAGRQKPRSPPGQMAVVREILQNALARDRGHRRRKSASERRAGEARASCAHRRSARAFPCKGSSPNSRSWGCRERRGPAAEAQAHYLETRASARTPGATARSAGLAQLSRPRPDARPDKRDRRRLVRLHRDQSERPQSQIRDRSRGRPSRSSTRVSGCNVSQLRIHAKRPSPARRWAGCAAWGLGPKRLAIWLNPGLWPQMSMWPKPGSCFASRRHVVSGSPGTVRARTDLLDIKVAGARRRSRPCSTRARPDSPRSSPA